MADIQYSFDIYRVKLLKRVLSRLSGYAYPQEYLCLDEAPFTNPLLAYWTINDTIAGEVTQDHVFAGYSPLLFAFSSIKLPGLADHPFITIRFSPHTLPVDALLKERDAVASLRLQKIRVQEMDGHIIYYYEGTEGRHHFLPAFNQYMIRMHNWLYQQKTGNVYLDHTLYPQVQIAYALPRMISLITVNIENGYNLFPTDLNGQISNNQYIISLRHGGMACRQVEEAGRIVISTVAPSCYKEAYRLGKNHMQPARPAESFDFSENTSKMLGLPLPRIIHSYRELELSGSFDWGIHRILLFTILHQQDSQAGALSLRHIHNSYATWRRKHGLSGNYMLR